jgi:hypothetical protein
MLCQTTARMLARSLLCTLFCSSALAGVNAWTVKGPPGGSFADIEAHPADSNVLYATFARSFFRSTDGGLTWQATRNFVRHVQDIAVDPTDGNRLYVAVLEDGLFRSENGGQSFEQVASGTAQIWSVGAADDGQTVYYADALGRFFRSTDRGQNWTERTSVGMTATRIQIEPAQPDVIIAIRGLDLMRSNNGGSTWAQSTIDSESINSIVRLSPTVLVAATADGLHRSTNDGGSWTEIFDGRYTSIAADPVDPATVYAASSGVDQALLRSTDSGATWNTFGTGPLGITRKVMVGPGSRFIVANSQGVQRSADTGATWTEATSGPLASAPTGLATTLAANSKVYAHASGDGDGLFVMSDDSTWQRIDIRDAYTQLGAVSAQTAVSLKPGSPDQIFLGVFGAGIARSADGGSNWTASATNLNGFGITAFGFDADDASTLYAGLTSGTATPPAAVYRSIDNGDTWQSHSLDVPNVFPMRLLVDPSDGDRMFLGTFQGLSAPGASGLYRTINRGLNWTRVAFAGQDVLDIEIDPSNPAIVYAATRTGLHVSTNGGDTFVANAAFDAITAFAARAIEIDPVVPTTLYVASIDPGDIQPQKSSWVLRSVDSGQSWETLRAESAEPRWYASDLALDPNLPTRLYVTTGGHGVGAFEIVNDLEISIAGHAGFVPRGIASSFDVRVENDGPYAGTALTTEIDLPAGLTNVTWTPSAGSCSRAGDTITCGAGVLRSAQTLTISVGYTAPANMALPVAVSVSAHERDGTAANNTAQATASVTEVTDLSVTLTPTPATVDRGDSLTYTAQVSNAGPNDSSASILMLMPDAGLTLGTLPTGCVAAGANITCTLAALASGASRSFAFPVTTNSIGTFTSSAGIAAAPGAHDPSPANNGVSSDVVARAIADLSVAITDNTDPVSTGTSYEYSIVLQNTGPDSANDVVANLTAPGTVSNVTSTQGTCTSNAGGRQCAIGTLASGASATITVTTSSATAGSVSMQANVTFPGADRVATNNSAQQSTTVNAPPGGGGGGGGSSSGGGGGALDLGWLLLGLTLAAARLAAHAHRNGIAKRRPAVF